MNTISKAITINSRKYDGRLHRSWQATLTEQSTSLLKFVGEFDQEIKHQHIGVIRRGTVSYEYYWLERWYNVFRFHEPVLRLRPSERDLLESALDRPNARSLSFSMATGAIAPS